ncbi:hypothetical protein ACIBKZ_23755 [Streptomyces sp. NPDC050421]|uniref:hypothetical protein n=1 Tax=Streptomyces sp. NPDC050421 TaxID=3365613 RepID=UPI0037B9B875
MRHRSTLLSKAFGAAALASTAVAYGTALVRGNADAPRWDVLVPLTVGALLAGCWVLAVRAAPPVVRQPVAPARAQIPATLGAIRRDWRHITMAYLVIWAPFFAGAAAQRGSGSTLGGIWCSLTAFFAIVLSFYVLALVTTQLGPGQKILRADAAAGRVHAVRARFGDAVREQYRRPTGTGVGSISTVDFYYAELLPEGEDGVRAVRPTVRFAAMSGDSFRINLGDKHLSRAAAELVGHSGWLCWPTRWKDLAGTDKQRRVAAAFVTDTGHVVWGHTREDDWTTWLRGEIAPVRETDPTLSAQVLPSPSRFLPAAHGVSLLYAAAAAVLAVPYLVGAAPFGVGIGLGVAAGVVGFIAGGRMSSGAKGLDPALWTVRQESHSSLQ